MSIVQVESKASFDQLVKDTPIVVTDCECPAFAALARGLR